MKFEYEEVKEPVRKEPYAFIHKSGCLIIKTRKGHIVISNYDIFEIEKGHNDWNYWMDNKEDCVVKEFYEGDKVTIEFGPWTRMNETD